MSSRSPVRLGGHDPGGRTHRLRRSGERLVRRLGFHQRQHDRGRRGQRHGRPQPACRGGIRLHRTRRRLDEHDPDRQAHRPRWPGERRFGISVSISGNTIAVGADNPYYLNSPRRGLRLHRARCRLGQHDPGGRTHRVRRRGERLLRLLGFDQRQHGRGRSLGSHGRRQQPRERPTSSRSPAPVGPT